MKNKIKVCLIIIAALICIIALDYLINLTSNRNLYIFILIVIGGFLLLIQNFFGKPKSNDSDSSEQSSSKE